MKIYCRSCLKVTKHRQKGLRNPVNVCNKCDISNMPVRLVKSNGETHLGREVKFVEWKGEELGSLAKELHEQPQTGFSCLIDPQYGYSYTWLTTPIEEIVSDTKHEDVRTIEFQTKNSSYILYIYNT